MSFEIPGQFIGNLTAVGNYSSATSLYTAVKSTAATSFSKQTTKGGVVLGVLVDRPSSGFTGMIQMSGVTKCRVTAATHVAIAVGDKIICSSGAGFRASSGTGNVGYFVVGRAREALAANTTGIIAVQITMEGSGSSGAQSAA